MTALVLVLSAPMSFLRRRRDPACTRSNPPSVAPGLPDTTTATGVAPVPTGASDPEPSGPVLVPAARPAPHRNRPAELWHPDLVIVDGVVPSLPEERVAASELEDAPVMPSASTPASAPTAERDEVGSDRADPEPGPVPSAGPALPPPVDLFSRSPALDPLQEASPVDPAEVSAARSRLLDAPVRRRVASTSSGPTRRRLFGQPVPSDHGVDHGR